MTMLELCDDSLDGLSVGDALGAQFFVPGTSFSALVDGRLPEAPWPWTDDTEMACSIVHELHDHGEIDQDRLATRFAEHFEPYRGYGGGAVVILRQIRAGVAWQEAAGAAFGGLGSMGNGAAMRVAPVGAFHAGASRTAALQAMRSAEVTHAHPEAILGAVAVAVAATRLDDYPAALYACIEAGGDVDTTSAMVGGIVAAYTGTGPNGIPAEWLNRREPTPPRVLGPPRSWHP